MKTLKLTLNHLYARLRRYNYKNYLLLLFCLGLSVLLVSSYAMIYFSPTVQNILPKGGDSRKMGTMIFAVAIIGCGIFTLYASSLFFKCKSREMGIFLALGAKKKQLSRILFQDILVVCALGCGIGLILGAPVSRGVWGLFQTFIIDTREMKYQFSFQGLLIGLVFALIVCFSIFFMAMRFLGRTNIIDILNDQRKSESIRQVSRWYGVAGIALIAVGLVLGYELHGFVLRHFQYLVPRAITNSFYLLAIVGVYLLMVFVVGYARRGKHPHRYYKNIISISMMRFVGRQTVRNMCVIVLLLFGAFFALFYLPQTFLGAQEAAKTARHDYQFFYPANNPPIATDDLNRIAEEYNTEILHYKETQSLLLFTDGRNEIRKEDNTVTFEYVKQNVGGNFFSSSAFAKLTGQSYPVEKGTLVEVVSGDIEEPYKKVLVTQPLTIEERTYPVTNTVSYKGGLFHSFNDAYFVMNDADYEYYNEQLPEKYKHQTVSFDVKDWESTYAFASALKNEIIENTPKESAVFLSSDLLAKERDIAKYGFYWLEKEEPPGTGNLELSPDNGTLAISWKYYPDFRILITQDSLKNMAVFLMLFAYISLVCLATVGIIAYTRGISIALNYKQVFVDLVRLGANHRYVTFCIKSQLRKIFFLPAVTGGALSLLYLLLILSGNDGKIQLLEWKAFGVDLLMLAVVLLYIYGIYTITFVKFKKEIGISK